MFKGKYTKKDVQKFLNSAIALLIGNFILAFGTALFLTKLNIVAGGLSGVGIILQYFFGKYFPGEQAIDIIVFALSVVLWIVGFFFVSKEFAIKTLPSTILYPLFLALFLRIPLFIELSESIAYYGVANPGVDIVPVGNLVLCGIFGGVFVGSGVALTFFGGGSTGGTDVLIALVSKYTPIKESIASFMIDGIIIVLSMFLIKDNVIPSLCGIVSAFVTALLIEQIYVGSQSAYQVDIISKEWESISRYVQDELGRGATIIRANGGYQGEDRVILRVVFDKTQYRKIRHYIFNVDPKAFVTFTQTNAVYGEGFKKVKK